MKIKELKRTVNVSWSPAEQYPVLLAAGSAAQQVDASFSSSSYLELYSLNLDDPGLDLELKSSLQTQHKFQKLVWSGAGVIVGGCDGGLLQFYSAEKILQNAPDALISSSTKHNGDVSALDVNPYQKNLVASGASESEIFIWDLNNTAQPMAPGNRSQPYDHVQSLVWNQQVQHILGSTFATRCVVWDLRKNEPIMKLSDAQGRTRWRAAAWHPGVATQLCVASEDDQSPVIQLWDLRLAASPLATFEGHHKGVMALSWSRHDPDLLLSAGKDGRLLCWNPNNTQPGGELLAELSQQQQWVFEAAWAPRVPGLLVSAAFDQQVAVHALLAGSTPDVSAGVVSNIMDSFGGADSFSALPAVARAPAPVRPAAFPRAPRWLKRPARARFAFGGKLVTFEKSPPEAGAQRLVYISQVISEPELIERAAELDAALGTGHEPAASETLAEYCRARGDAATAQDERYTWFYLRASFLPDFRTEALNLLGFKQDEIPSKFKSPSMAGGLGDAVLSGGESSETEAELSPDAGADLTEATDLLERKLADVELEPTVENVVIPNREDPVSLICRALVCGNLEEAAELCLAAGRTADALLIASLGSPELVYRVQRYHLRQTARDPVSLVAGSLLAGRWDALVRGAAPSSWRETLAAVLTHCDGEALAHYCEMLGDKLAAESDPALSEAATVCYLCAMSPDALVARWSRARPREPAALARLTERALLARRAAAARGRRLESNAKLESVLWQYAWRLAAQGCLHSALLALEGGAAPSLADLADRLRHALGLVHHAQQAAQPAQGARVARAAPTRAEPARPYAHAPGMGSAFEPASPWASAQPAPAVVHPPRPGSVGPQPGGITSKSKYKVDPSVQSAPLYNNYNFNNPIPPQPSYGFNSPLPDQYSGASVPNPGYGSTNQPINPPYAINPVNPINPLNPNPLNPVNPINPGAPMNASVLSPAVNGAYYGAPAGEPALPVVPAPPARAAAPGWNDPPMLSSSKPKPKQEVQSQAPITHPLFGVEPPQHVPLAPAAPVAFPGQQYQGQHYPGQQSQEQQYLGQQYAPQQYSEQQFPQGQYSPQIPQNYPQQAVSPAAVARAPTPAPKPPLPAPHAELQHVFDGLRAGCADRATAPQMKRKLDDVQRRLETLYDLLRENKLSESALATLHACAGCARRGEHGGAMQAAASLAAGADFAAAASFLPALKALCQLAAQLNVALPA